MHKCSHAFTSQVFKSEYAHMPSQMGFVPQPACKKVPVRGLRTRAVLQPCARDDTIVWIF